MSIKQQIIEPISGIAKIILFLFKSDNAKLSLRGFSIHFDELEENMPYIQHVINRTLRRDSREDIAVLEEMIINLLDWYIINNDDKDMRDKIVKLAQLSILGFRKLQMKAYGANLFNKSKNNVKLALQYYINLINIVLEDIDKYKDKEKFDKLLVPDDTNIVDKISLINSDGFRKLWTSDEISQLYHEMTDCFDFNLEKKTDVYTAVKVKGLIEFLEKKDEVFKNEIIKLVGLS